jgi:hypothetical protein
MITTEEILARFIFFFLKHLSIELNNLAILTNHHRLPKKSILRKSYDQTLSLNQNNSVLLTQQIDHRRQVFFTHVDSFEFDPQIPCRFLRPSQRKEFSFSTNPHQTSCLCHQKSKTDYPNKSKIKLKRQQK